MSNETPYNKRVETIRPQIADDMGTSQSGEPVHEEEVHHEALRAQSVEQPSSIAKGGIWGWQSRSIEDQMEQVERLRTRRKKLREATLVPHANMMKEDEDYKAIQKKIIAIRKRLNEIAVQGIAEERKEEVQKLRDELAQHFTAFRKEVKRRIAENAAKEKHTEESIVEAPAEPSTGELEAIVDKGADTLNGVWANGEKPPQTAEAASEWHVTPTVTYDESMLQMLRDTHGTEALKSEQWDVAAKAGYADDQETKEMLARGIPTGNDLPPVEPPKPPQGPEGTPEKKEFQKRLQEREVWREKKHAFETAYKTYVAQDALKRSNRSLLEKVQFWKKEAKPQGLVELEREYQEARRAYALSLHGAILERIDARNPDRETERDKQILQVALANRFIIKAANERLRAEGESIPHVEGRRTLAKLLSVFKKNNKLIKAAGYATVGGIALASGGVAVAVAALAGKAVQTKITAAAMAGGLTAGAFAGNFLSDRIIDSADKKRLGAMRTAAQSFSSRALDRLEIEYLNAYRKHTQAVEQKKYIVGAGAALGAVGGALLAGNLEVPEGLPSVPETPVPPLPVEPVPVPDLEIPAPVEEGVKPDDLLPEPSYPMHEGEPYDHAHDSGEEAREADPSITSILYTFEGGNIDTVSEALFDTWKDNPAVLDADVSKSEFLAKMYTAIAEIEKNPALNTELLERMRIDSWDIDQVREGQTVDLQPFFEYLNNKQ